MFIIKI